VYINIHTKRAIRFDHRLRPVLSFTGQLLYLTSINGPLRVTNIDALYEAGENNSNMAFSMLKVRN
jgi:hypothetical protein